MLPMYLAMIANMTVKYGLTSRRIKRQLRAFKDRATKQINVLKI